MKLNLSKIFAELFFLLCLQSSSWTFLRKLLQSTMKGKPRWGRAKKLSSSPGRKKFFINNFRVVEQFFLCLCEKSFIVRWDVVLLCLECSAGWRKKAMKIENCWPFLFLLHLRWIYWTSSCPFNFPIGKISSFPPEWFVPLWPFLWGYCWCRLGSWSFNFSFFSHHSTTSSTRISPRSAVKRTRTFHCDKSRKTFLKLFKWILEMEASQSRRV